MLANQHFLPFPKCFVTFTQGKFNLKVTFFCRLQQLSFWTVVVVVLRFNPALTANVIWWSVTHMFPGFLSQVLTQISFQSHRLLFSHASAEVRGDNTLERNFTSTGSQTHNQQVISPTRSPLSHPGGWTVLEYCP